MNSDRVFDCKPTDFAVIIRGERGDQKWLELLSNSMFLMVVLLSSIRVSFCAQVFFFFLTS